MRHLMLLLTKKSSNHKFLYPCAFFFTFPEVFLAYRIWKTETWELNYEKPNIHGENVNANVRLVIIDERQAFHNLGFVWFGWKIEGISEFNLRTR